MNDNECMCYITYAVPKNMLPDFMGFGKPIEKTQQPSLYPPGFMPRWYYNSSFPEDDMENE